VEAKDVKSRLNICKGCSFFRGNRCIKCGCYMKFKAKLRSSKCPIGRW
jgi:hypothetical protein